MITYFLRSISVMLAVVYTVTGICINSVLPVEPEASTAMLPSESEVKEPKEISIKILQNREGIGLLLQQAIDLYSEKCVDDINFSVQTIAFESDYHSALRAGLLAADGADLFQISGAREYFELENHIRAIDSCDWVMSACDGALDAVSHGGHIYGVPYSIEATGLICNKDAFEAAEILPESIRSLNDLDEAFAKIRDKIALGDSEALIGMENVTEFAVNDKAFIGSKLADIALSGAFSTPVDAALSKTASFPASDEAEEFIKIMAKYSQYRTDWTKIAETTVAQQIESLANGRVAAILQDTGTYKRINEINPGASGKMLLLPIPLDIFEQPSVYVGVPSYWVINAAISDKEAAAAIGFLEWLYTSDEGGELFALEFGEASAYRKTAKNTGISLQNQMLSYMSADMAMPQLNREFPAGWGKDIFAPNVQSYFTEREKTWNEVIEDCKEGWAAV